MKQIRIDSAVAKQDISMSTTGRLQINLNRDYKYFIAGADKSGKSVPACSKDGKVWFYCIAVRIRHETLSGQKLLDLMEIF